MDAIKSFIEKYNVSLTVIGTAVVLSVFGQQCSYDYATGEVEASVNPSEIAEAVSADEESDEGIEEVAAE